MKAIDVFSKLWSVEEKGRAEENGRESLNRLPSPCDYETEPLVLMAHSQLLGLQCS